MCGLLHVCDCDEVWLDMERRGYTKEGLENCLFMLSKVLTYMEVSNNLELCYFMLHIVWSALGLLRHHL